jgi:archaeal flagellin FlaB
MRNVKKMLKEDDVGDMGIGAMIVFIAMVLVAGIAASVLIQTANRLEIQAMRTGQQTTNEVATGIGVEDITGEVNAGAIRNVAITVGPRSGSMDIDLSNTVIEISNSGSKYILSYLLADYAAGPAAAGVFATAAFPATTHNFGVIVLEDADGSCVAANPVINRGDHVLLTLSSLTIFGGLTERTDIWGRVIPENGAPGVFAFRTPASYSEVVYDLY